MPWGRAGPTLECEAKRAQPAGALSDNSQTHARTRSVEGAAMWIEAIVMPRQSAELNQPLPRRKRGAAAVRLSPPDRRSAYERAMEEGRRFRDAVLAFLKAHHLMDAVRWISEPGTIPLVTLQCTRLVLERLRQAPEFEAGLSMSFEVPAT
ncbi:hypothetical protein GCM10012319_19080 [Comamonas sp. KCTC 72670]|nr:hypothetical protein GCM10012319_19080 [Comamonas sp. KCTC 72670]